MPNHPFLCRWRGGFLALGLSLAAPALLLAQDSEPPVLEKAQRLGFPSSITLTFNEPVSAASAGDKARYTLDNGASVQTVAILSPTSVRLDTTTLSDEAIYTLTVNGLVDLATPPNTQTTAQSLLVNSAQGSITLRTYTGLFGGSIESLISDAKFPDSPDLVSYSTNMENSENTAIVGYQMAGYLHPQQSGIYYFYISGNNTTTRLLLSSDSDPNNKIELILGGTTGVQNFSAPSAEVLLEAGQKYYIEALAKRVWGGGSFHVGWQYEGWSEPQLITGESLSSLAASGPISISAPPVATTTSVGGTVELTVGAAGTPPYSYQWRKNGGAISGATGASYRIAFASVEDAGDYTVEVKNAFSSAISASAKLTVQGGSGVAGPHLVSAGSFAGGPIGVQFDTTLDPASAADLANYRVFANGKAYPITKATVRADGRSVLLEFVGNDLPDPFTVKIEGVKNSQGVAMGEAGLILGSRLDLTLEDIGGPIESGSAVSTKGGSVEVIAGGLRTWDNSDSFNFIYTERTGSFDVSVRVDSVEQLGAKGGDPKAALMARADTTPGSQNVSLNVVATRGYIEYLNRPNANGGTTEFNPSTSPGLTFPQWIRLQRDGDVFRSFRSANGKDWTVISEGIVVMPEAILVGLNTNPDINEAGARLKVQYSNLSLAPADQGFQWTDIGDPAPITAGKVSFGTEPGEVEVEAGGLRTWDNTDSFNFVYKEYTGDFDVKVRVNSVTQNGTPGGDPKAALMARADLTPGSPNVSLNVVATRGYIEYLYRPNANSGTTEFSPSTSPGLTFPQWIRLRRSGNKFISYRSTDSRNWSKVSEGEVGLPETVLVGLNTNSDIDREGSSLSVSYSGLGNVSSKITLADQGLAAADIGGPIEAGYVTTPDGCGDIDVVAGGLRTWDNSDSFTFVYEPKQGDFDVRVRVDKVEQLGAPGGDPKAALMARENIEPGSPNVSLNVVATRGYIEYLYRPTQNGGTTEFNPSTSPGLTFPQWIRLKREANTFTSFRSTDGFTWTQISSGEVSMADEILVGLNTNADRDEAGSLLSVQYRDYGPVPAQRPAPSLSAVRGPAGFVLSWPEADAGFVLEGKGSITDPIWNTVPGAPAVVNGRYTVTIPNTAPAAYFRLRQP